MVALLRKMVAVEQMQKLAGRAVADRQALFKSSHDQELRVLLLLLAFVLSLDKAMGGKKEGKVQVPLAPTPSDSRRSTSTCLSSKQAVEEASLWWRVRPVYVQVWAQLPVSLVDVDFFEALHFYHLRVRRVFSPDLHCVTHLDHFQSTHTTRL